MITSLDFVIERLKKNNKEFAVVSNPSYVYPREDYYPLAEPRKSVTALKGALMDMDGTTTTTEELCIYSLEQMVRRMSGKMLPEEWQGLDRQNDYSHIIGNSTTKHVEYLVRKYENLLDEKFIRKEFLRAALWTIQHGKDNTRKEEVAVNLKKMGLGDIITNIEKDGIEPENWEQYFDIGISLSFGDKVSIGIDIYYMVYHQILGRLANESSAKVKQDLFGINADEKELISPMPGISVLLPLLKGWLNSTDIEVLSRQVIQEYRTGNFDAKNDYHLVDMLIKLSDQFKEKPVKLGLVTSSIFYEADIVIKQVFRVIREFYHNSELSGNKKRFLIEQFSDYHNIYDAFVTATDSSEIRLKPHRDLYSIALHKLGIMPENFDQVIGFEDSQSGTVAIRAAGIGCCIAVPFAQTSSHNFEAAVHVLQGGIPQALLEYNMFINQEKKK